MQAGSLAGVLRGRKSAWTLLGITVACSASVTATADLYWCNQPGGNAAIVQIKVPGAECRLIAKEGTPAPPAAIGGNTATPAPARPRATTSDHEGFPVVGSSEQEVRDNMRFTILNEELEYENRLLAKVQQIIASPRGRNFNPDEREYYQTRLRIHLNNIKALRLEIGRAE